MCKHDIVRILFLDLSETILTDLKINHANMPHQKSMWYAYAQMLMI